jgi:hypothetical protein
MDDAEVSVTRMGSSAPVEWRVTNSPCTLRRPYGDPVPMMG